MTKQKAGHVWAHLQENYERVVDVDYQEECRVLCVGRTSFIDSYWVDKEGKWCNKRHSEKP